MNACVKAPAPPVTQHAGLPRYLRYLCLLFVNVKAQKHMPPPDPADALSGGRVRHGRWVPQMAKKCRAPKAEHPQLLVGESIGPQAPRMIRGYNASVDFEIESAAQYRSMDLLHAKAVRSCGGDEHTVGPTPAVPFAASSSTPLRKWTCESVTSFAQAGVWLLMGVHTSPVNRVRRDAIRKSWATWTTTGSAVCYVLGVRGLSGSVDNLVAAEASERGDVLRLPHVNDGGCHMTIQKAHAWWAWAANSSVPYLGRVDDDTYVHLPNLEATLRPLHCHAHLVYGMLAYVGYNPQTFRKCGFSWGGTGAWRKYGCGAAGAHMASLFPAGMLQVLSRPVALQVASSREINAFVARATKLLELRAWDRTEDVALGFWVQQLLADGILANVSFVRASNRQAHNLGCQKRNAMYHPPTPLSVAVHYVKKPSGMAYIHSLYGEHSATYHPKACTRAAGVA